MQYGTDGVFEMAELQQQRLAFTTLTHHCCNVSYKFPRLVSQDPTNSVTCASLLHFANPFHLRIRVWHLQAFLRTQTGKKK
jgi:hypothetical protein